VIRLASLVLLALMVPIIAACNPLEEEEPTSVATTATEARAPQATLAPLRIVTPTPIDPRRIPATATEPAGEISVPSTYIVEEGDSLYSIAIKFQLNLAEIVALNGLSDPNDIEVGQELQLPVTE
jgi:LysM repeat protein